MQRISRMLHDAISYNTSVDALEDRGENIQYCAVTHQSNGTAQLPRVILFAAQVVKRLNVIKNFYTAVDDQKSLLYIHIYIYTGMVLLFGSHRTNWLLCNEPVT